MNPPVIAIDLCDDSDESSEHERSTVTQKRKRPIDEPNHDDTELPLKKTVFKDASTRKYGCLEESSSSDSEMDAYLRKDFTLFGKKKEVSVRPSDPSLEKKDPSRRSSSPHHDSKSKRAKPSIEIDSTFLKNALSSSMHQSSVSNHAAPRIKNALCERDKKLPRGEKAEVIDLQDSSEDEDDDKQEGGFIPSPEKRTKTSSSDDSFEDDGDSTVTKEDPPEFQRSSSSNERTTSPEASHEFQRSSSGTEETKSPDSPPEFQRFSSSKKKLNSPEILVLSSSDEEPDTPARSFSLETAKPSALSPSSSPASKTGALWSPRRESFDPTTATFADLRSPVASASPAPNRSTPSSSIETIPTPPLPVLNQIGGRLYPDLRHEFVRALHAHARRNRNASHQQCTFNATVRAMVVLSLRDTPVRTCNALSRVKGVGSELLVVVRESEKQRKNKKENPYVPPTGKFGSVAPAVLVSLLNFENEVHRTYQNGEGSSKVHHCPLEELFSRVNRIVHINKFDKPVSYYLDKDNIDPEYEQIKKLCASNINADLNPLIKQRKNKDASASGIVYELLPEGKALATSLVEVLRSPPCPPGPLRQLASTTTFPKYADVTICVDFREGGGGDHSLHKMCDLLDEHSVPYVVRELKISDYIFFVGDKLAPVLVERKNVDDVASSLKDGRWERQQRNMRMAQYVLGGGEARRCQICYLIEGDAGRSTVHGGNVGRRSWDQSLEDVNNAIDELPKLGFGVMSSKSKMGSMKILAQIANDVSWKSKNNSIDCDLTYDEFLLRIRRCDPRKGDPPTSTEHQNPAPPVVDATQLSQTSIAQQRQQQEDDGQSPFRNGASRQGHNEDDDRADENDTNFMSERDEAERNRLKKCSLGELKNMCKERDEKQSGSKKELIDRLMKPRKPEILIIRSRRGQYVPRVPSSNAAMMVAMLLNEDLSGKGHTKENLMMLADETGISKDPMGGNGGWYDGWSGMKDLTKGDPALVYVTKKRYRLTTQPSGSAGVDVAKALHILAHREKICNCNRYVPDH